MKEKYLFLIIYIILFFVLSISLYNIFFPKSMLLGEQYKVLYEPLDNNINVIEINMNEITISNNDFKWWKLKNIAIDDENLKNTYSLLVEDIRNCYLQTTDLKNKTYKNIKILNFKNKRRITEKDLLKLNQKESCLKDFNKYNSLVLSDNENTSERIKKQISIIIDYETELTNYKTFYELLYEELVTINKVANLSKWLKIEYDSRK